MGTIVEALWRQDGFWRLLEDNGGQCNQAGICKQTASIRPPSPSICPMNAFHVPFVHRKSLGDPLRRQPVSEFFGSYARTTTLLVFTHHRFSPASSRQLLGCLLWSKYYFLEGDTIQFIITMVSGLNHRWRRDGSRVWSIALWCWRKHRSSPLRIN